MKKKGECEMIFTLLGLYFILGGIKEDIFLVIIIGIIAALIGLFIEIRFELRFISYMTKKAKSANELRDLENQVKKEKLKQELDQLKQQNSN